MKQTENYNQNTEKILSQTGAGLAVSLEKLLDEQLSMMKKANNRQAHQSARLAFALSQKLRDTGLFEKKENEKIKKRIKKKYENLIVAVSAQRQEVSENLKKIRKQKKTVNTYAKAYNSS